MEETISIPNFLDKHFDFVLLGGAEQGPEGGRPPRDAEPDRDVQPLLLHRRLPRRASVFDAKVQELHPQEHQRGHPVLSQVRPHKVLHWSLLPRWTFGNQNSWKFIRFRFVFVQLDNYSFIEKGNK